MHLGQWVVPADAYSQRQAPARAVAAQLALQGEALIATARNQSGVCSNTGADSPSVPAALMATSSRPKRAVCGTVYAAVIAVNVC